MGGKQRPADKLHLSTHGQHETAADRMQALDAFIAIGVTRGIVEIKSARIPNAREVFVRPPEQIRIRIPGV